MIRGYSRNDKRIFKERDDKRIFKESWPKLKHLCPAPPSLLTKTLSWSGLGSCRLSFWLRLPSFSNSWLPTPSRQIFKLKKGYHGFHIHKFGNLIEGCKTAGPHFNTYKTNIHGGPRSKIKHNGDLGNIKTTKKVTSGRKVISSSVFSLDPCNKNSIIGRSIIVHKDKDDLGKGGDLESLKTGNAGARLACGVIGLSK